MKKVLLGIPSLTGNLPVQFVDSLINTLRLNNNELYINYIIISFDSLIQRVRNDILNIFYDSDFDELIMIDDDQTWDLNTILQLINCKKEFVGIPVLKKDRSGFNIKSNSSCFQLEDDGSMEIDGIGTGVLKINKNVLSSIQSLSRDYKEDNADKIKKMYIDISITEEGFFLSEDFTFCKKYKNVGGKIFCLPNFQVGHIGESVYIDNFLNYLKNNKLIKT